MKIHGKKGRVWSGDGFSLLELWDVLIGWVYGCARKNSSALLE